MRKCECCGAYLDPQEICDCQRVEDEQTLVCVSPPKIVDNIASVSVYVKGVTDKLATLSKDKDGCAEAKAMRAALRRKLDEAEEQRKAVKKAVLEPYNAAERKYKEHISGPLQAADQYLKEWIDDYQNGVKQACQAELEDYFNELCGALHIDFVTFADTGVKIDMATANLQDPRKARNTIHNYLNGIEDDLRTIAGMENAAEVLAEYKIYKSLSAAIAAVNERKIRQAQAVRELDQAKIPEKRQPEVLSAPTAMPEEQKMKCTFTVRATRTQLKRLKDFMTTEGISYE